MWVGVSAQRVGVHSLRGPEQCALRGWDPERYGTLDHPGDDFSFDIYTQAARAIGPAMLGGAEAEQSGCQRGFTVGDAAACLRECHSADGAAIRRLVIAPRLREGALPDTRDIDTATLPMATVPVQIHADLGVPALVFNSETEAPSLLPVRRARHRHTPVVGGSRDVPSQRCGRTRRRWYRSSSVKASRLHGWQQSGWRPIRAAEPERVALHTGVPCRVPPLPRLARGRSAASAACSH